MGDVAMSAPDALQLGANRTDESLHLQVLGARVVDHQRD
jgi:hypothetical protein